MAMNGPPRGKHPAPPPSPPPPVRRGSVEPRPAPPAEDATQGTVVGWALLAKLFGLW